MFYLVPGILGTFLQKNVKRKQLTTTVKQKYLSANRVRSLRQGLFLVIDANEEIPSLEKHPLSPCYLQRKPFSTFPGVLVWSLPRKNRSDEGHSEKAAGNEERKQCKKQEAALEQDGCGQDELTETNALH